MAYLGNEPDVIKTAETVTNTANNTTNETVYLVFSDTQGATTALETDSSLTYNPSTNLLSSAGNITSGSSIEATTSVQTGIINATTHTGTTGTFSGNITASYVIGTATEALYADLAENYEADDNYAPGTVLIFGGSAEVTTTDKTHDTRVAGVVSTNPAYLMNKDSGNTSLGLTGRLPCLVKGPVDKGTLLVTSDTPGVAQALNDAYYKPGCVVGKSMNTLTDSSIELIEIAVGRF